MTNLYTFRQHTEAGELPCFIINEVLNPEECNKLIEDQKNNLETAEHQWNGEKAPVGELKNIRDSRTAWFINPGLSDVIRSCVDIVNYEAGWRYDIVDHETFQFTEYTKGQHYSWHTDGPGCCHNAARKSCVLHNKDTLEYTSQSNLLGTVRKISVSGILNDDYEGGELQFRTLSPMGEIEEFSVVCKKGDVVVFPSYINHRVKPVTKGVRYSIVAWYGGPPFK